MLGVPRLRQLRTGNQSCIIHPDFEKAIKRCHGSYSYATEDTSGKVNISVLQLAKYLDVYMSLCLFQKTIDKVLYYLFEKK